MHFKTAGSYIVTISVLCGGLLLCTDYVLLRLIAHVLGFSVGSAVKVKSKLKITGAKNPSLNAKMTSTTTFPLGRLPVGGLNVRISGKKTEAIVDKTGRINDEPSDDADEATESPDEDEVEDGAATDTDGPSEKTGVGRRLANALRIKVPGKTDREAVMLELDEASLTEETDDYELPPIDICRRKHVLSRSTKKKSAAKPRSSKRRSLDFGYKVKVVQIDTGPVITQFEIELEAGLRVSKITGLADDLAIALRVPSVRIVAPIPGKTTVGIEVPNEQRQIVRLREVIEEANGKVKKMRIPLFLGKDVRGNAAGRRPGRHAPPADRRPHRHGQERLPERDDPVDPDDAAARRGADADDRPQDGRALAVQADPAPDAPGRHRHEEGRGDPGLGLRQDGRALRLLARAGVRHISSYNQLGAEELIDRLQPEDDEERASDPAAMPYIVIIADEMADLMMTAGKEVEQHIVRLAQKTPGGRHAPDPRHAEADGRRHHRA